MNLKTNAMQKRQKMDGRPIPHPIIFQPKNTRAAVPESWVRCGLAVGVRWPLFPFFRLPGRSLGSSSDCLRRVHSPSVRLKCSCGAAKCHGGWAKIPPPYGHPPGWRRYLFCCAGQTIVYRCENHAAFMQPVRNEEFRRGGRLTRN